MTEGASFWEVISTSHPQNVSRCARIASIPRHPVWHRITGIGQSRRDGKVSAGPHAGLSLPCGRLSPRPNFRWQPRNTAGLAVCHKGTRAQVHPATSVDHSAMGTLSDHAPLIAEFQVPPLRGQWGCRSGFIRPGTCGPRSVPKCARIAEELIAWAGLEARRVGTKGPHGLCPLTDCQHAMAIRRKSGSNSTN